MSERRAPRPGAPVRGSRTGRSIMAALDLLGRRWSLRILWELRAGPVGARELVGRCGGVSTSVLYERLRELTDVGLVSQDEANAYVLTEIGWDLAVALAPLDAWAERWARALGNDR